MRDDKDKSKFDFYEIVKVRHNRPKQNIPLGKDAILKGKARNDDGVWSYAIRMDEGGYSVDSDQLESTGRFDNPENHKPVGSIRVGIDEHGEGYCIDNPNAMIVENLDDEE